jgi:hypothetical protein
MPRRLSNIEWSTLQHEVELNALGLPPWGGVIHWRDMDVLVFQGASGEWFLTDVSDLAGRFADYPKSYVPEWGVFVYSLPQSVMESAIAAPEIVSNAVIWTAGKVGAAAGAIVQPLALPLIVIGLVAGFLILREVHV